LALALAAHAQTAVYVRSSGPQQQVITGCTNATPVVCATYAPHGFSLSCNTTTNVCYCGPMGVNAGVSPTPINYVRECVPTDATHLALYDLSGNPIAGNGAYYNTYGLPLNPNIGLGASWISPLTKYMIPSNAGPLGYFDGANGDLVRRLALSTVNGLTSSNGVVVSGCIGGVNCVVTISTTYNPTTFGRFPIAAGNHFSVNGSGTVLDTCGDGTATAGAQSPYTVASTTASSWTSAPFSCSGLANGDYTNVNMHCGPSATPNDLVGGAQSCTRVSQMGWTGNPWWMSVLASQNGNFSQTPNFKSQFDGGAFASGNGIQSSYSGAVDRFAVDPTNDAIVNATVSSGGIGYSVGDTITIVQPGASGGQAVIASVSGGAVTGLTSITQGVKYATATTLVTSGGHGSGLTVNITVGSFWLNEIIYSLNYDFRTSGTGYAYNSNAWVGQVNVDYNYTLDMDGLALEYAWAAHSPEGQYWTSSEMSTFLDRMYIDIDDPSAVGTTTNQDAANTATHNWQLSPSTPGTWGLLVPGTNDATHASIPNTDPHYSPATFALTAAGNASGGNTVYTGTIAGGGAGALVGQYYNISGFTNAANNGTSLLCVASTSTTLTLANSGGVAETHGGSAFYAYYVNTEIAITSPNNGNQWSGYDFGLITGQSSTGVLTVARWVDINGGTVPGPALNGVVSGTYGGGLTCHGTTGQAVIVNLNGTGETAAGVGYFTLADNIGTVGPALTVQIAGAYTGAPAGGNLSNGGGPANCTGYATFSTTLGTQYAIFDTVTTSNTSAGPATITFTKTTALSGAIHVGDGVWAANGYGNASPASAMALVTAVGTNTLSVMNTSTTSVSATTPRQAWRIPQWVAGDVGRLCVSKHDGGNSAGVATSIYGTGGSGATGTGSGTIKDTATNGAGAAPEAWIAFELATATDDPRAVRDLARNQSYMFDNGVRPNMDYMTGRGRNGPGYSVDSDAPVAENVVWTLSQSLPGYPTLGIDQAWGQGPAIWWMYCTLPDNLLSQPWFCGYGGAGALQYGPNGVLLNGTAFNAPFWFAPTSNTAAWSRNWMSTLAGGSIWGAPPAQRQSLAFLANDPRVPSSDYTVQPHQFNFVKSGSSYVTPNTGWPNLYIGDAVISRTGWSSANDTFSLFDCSTFTEDLGTYDSPRICNLSVYKTGQLLGCDNSHANGLWSFSAETLCDTFTFDNIGLYSAVNTGIQPNIGNTPITRYSFETAGAYGAQYGDASSRFASACASIAPNYNQAELGIALDHAFQCWAHQKYPGHDEFIWDFRDVALTQGSPTAATTMNWHLHYPQNGAAQQIGSGAGSYPTGSTTCLSLSGSICTGGVIKSVEDGTAGRTHGLMSFVTSPFASTLNDDCVGLGNNGQCAPGNTYNGGLGFTHRFTLAGGSNINAKVNKFASVICHKVMQTVSDATLTPVTLNPDSHWTGAQCSGASSTGVALFAMGGTTYSSITPFTPSFSGPGDWIIMGLATGSYVVSVGGNQVAGSPFTVLAGDNSIEFSSPAGQAVITSGVMIPSSSRVDGNVTLGGSFIIH
jgi:hypothetical protein